MLHQNQPVLTVPGIGRDIAVWFLNRVLNQRIEEDQFGTQRTPAIPPLNKAAQSALTGDPVLLTQKHAEQLLLQFHETCEYRKWLLVATAIMANHTHALI